MTQYTLDPDGKASDMMWDAAMGGGGPFVYCSCGIEHGADAEGDPEVDEGPHFNYVDLGGHLFVYGCEGCEKTLAKYENFIWQNRAMIRSYLKIRVDQEKAWADQEKMMNTIAGID